MNKSDIMKAEPRLTIKDLADYKFDTSSMARLPEFIKDPETGYISIKEHEKETPMNKSDIMKAAELARNWLDDVSGVSPSLQKDFAYTIIAAAELLKQVEWQPISEVGKLLGGEQFLGTDGESVCPIEWTGTEWFVHNITCFPAFENPTHWQSLPQPPVIIDKEGV